MVVSQLSFDHLNKSVTVMAPNCWCRGLSRNAEFRVAANIAAVMSSFSATELPKNGDAASLAPASVLAFYCFLAPH